MNILQGDSLTVLRTLPECSAHLVVTSPPYWGLRDYGTASWQGGQPDCDHIQRHGLQGATGQRADRTATGYVPFKSECGKCGARRVDAQLGLEPVHDCAGWAKGDKCGACYICHMVEVFAEVRARPARRRDVLDQRRGQLCRELGKLWRLEPRSR